MTRICVDPMMATPRTPTWRYDAGCHLFCLHGDLDALRAFAQLLGLHRSFLHPAPGFPHFDLTASMRAKAVAGGAREVTRRDPDYIAYIKARVARAAAEKAALNPNPPFEAR